MTFALDFPPISHLVEWPILFGGEWLGVNKIVLEMWLAVVLVFGFFLLASRRQSLVPVGLQNVAESTVDFIRNGVILQTMGEDGLYWTPYLMVLFSFIFVCNIFEIIPLIQMPVTARIALPFFLAILTYFFYWFLGIKKHGFGGYLKGSLVPPGVPKIMLPLLVLIEFITIIFTRPFSLMVRLFANMFAGHLLLTTFAIISAALFAVQWQIVILPFSGFLLIALTGFELLVAFLQAFIFTILTAVYLGSSLHIEH